MRRARRFVRWSIALLSFLGGPLFARPQHGDQLAPEPRMWLLSVGVSQHKFQQWQDGAAYAGRDAEAIDLWFSALRHEELQQDCFAGGSSTCLLMNQKASVRQIKEQLHFLESVVKPEDSVLVFFSGHGVVIGNSALLVTYETPFPPPSSDIETNAISMHEFLSLFLAIRATNRFLFLDTCHAGSISDNYYERFFPEALESVNNDWARLERTVIFASARPKERSQSSELWGKGMGVFSYHLLQGLRLMGDNDGNVRIGRVIDFVTESVIHRTRGAQHPYPVNPYFDPNVIIAHQIGPGKEAQQEQLFFDVAGLRELSNKFEDSIDHEQYEQTLNLYTYLQRLTLDEDLHASRNVLLGIYGGKVRTAMGQYSQKILTRWLNQTPLLLDWEGMASMGALSKAVQEDEWKKAASTLTHYKELFPDESLFCEQMLFQAKVAHGEGRLAEAGQKIDACLSRQPSFGPATLARAEIKASQGDWTGAIDLCLKLSQTADFQYFARLFLIALYDETVQFDKEKAVLSELLKQRPDLPELKILDLILNRNLSIYLDSKELQQLDDLIKTMMEREPDNPLWPVYWGITLTIAYGLPMRVADEDADEDVDVGEALTKTNVYFEKARSLYPDPPTGQAMVCLFKAAIYIQRPLGKDKLFKPCYDLGQQYPGSWSAFLAEEIVNYTVSKDWTKAIRAGLSAEELRTTPIGKLTLGLLYADEEDYIPAEHYLERFVAQSTSGSYDSIQIAREYLVAIHLIKGEFQQAAAVAEFGMRALPATTTHAKFYLGLSLVALQRGNKELAIQDARKAAGMLERKLEHGFARGVRIEDFDWSSGITAFADGIEDKPSLIFSNLTDLLRRLPSQGDAKNLYAGRLEDLFAYYTVAALVRFQIRQSSESGCRYLSKLRSDLRSRGDSGRSGLLIDTVRAGLEDDDELNDRLQACLKRSVN